MLTRLMSAVLTGVDAQFVDIEVSLSAGSPMIIVVGLPDAVVRESRDRITTAIRNSGYSVPMRRIVVNLAPASVRKEGPQLDLPIALGILIASSQIEARVDLRMPILGELGLDGRLLGVRSALSTGILTRRSGMDRMLVPRENGAQALAAGLTSVFAADTLREAAHVLTSGTASPLQPDLQPAHQPPPPCPDMADVLGQPIARRSIEIAAAGSHNLLLSGPPGSGKTMLARRLPGILPPLEEEQAMDTSRIHGLRGHLDADHGLIRHVPFRAPHHTASAASIIGGGSQPMPGEISLAHNGVLFLDEFPEFRPDVIQALRQPLEDGIVTVPRAAQTIEFPARFMLVAAMNPCPCGYHGHPTRPCTCGPRMIERYRSRVSGPILDRIDLQVSLPPTDLRDLAQAPSGESTATIRARVDRARAFARERDPDTTGPNAWLTGQKLREVSRIDPQAEQVLVDSANRLNLTGRSFHKTLKVARTIADLAQEPIVGVEAVLEALHFRTVI